MKDPKVIDLMSRIRLIPDPEIIHTRAVVTVTTREGRTITEDVDILPMHLDSKWRAKSIPAKFRELVVPILGQKKAEKILRLCQDIDKIEDISLIPPLAG